MATCKSCNNCNSDNCSCERKCNNCQGCVGCQNCNASCNSGANCQTCQGSCDTKQTYWGQNKKTLFDFFGNFNWSLIVTANSTQMGTETGMFNKSVWDELSTYINKGNSLPVEPKSSEGLIKTNNPVGLSKISVSTNDAVSPFSAAEFNRLYKIVYNTTANKVSPGDLITADLFNNLASKASSIQISSTACRLCNAACDNGCNQCQVCVYCQNCNTSGSCQSGNSCGTCNRCQSGNCNAPVYEE